MSYQDRLERIRALITEFNSHAPNAGATKIDANGVFEKMVALGAVNDASAAKLTWEDLQSCGLPKIMAKQAADILRGPDEQESDGDGNYISTKRASRMTFAQLFQHYRAQPGHDDAVTVKLRELSGGKPCVVFTDEKARTVDVPTSVRLLEEIKRGMAPMNIVPVGDRLARVFLVGEVPDDELDQNPLYPARSLRTDETCDQTLRSWKGVPLVIRQILFLAVTKTGEAKVDSVGAAHDLLDRVMDAGDNVAKLGTRFGRAKLMLDELSRTGQAPRLKMKTAQVRSNSPFAGATA